MIHNTVVIWLIFLVIPIAGCKKDENANLFCVEVTEGETETLGVHSIPIQESTSPKKLQSIVLDRIHALRKKTSHESSPIFFLEYRCNGTKQGNTLPLKFMYDSERLALAMLYEKTWIPLCWGDWGSQKKYVQENIFTIENCTTFLKKAQEIGNKTNKATAELKVLSETLNTDDPARISELLKAGADVNVKNKYGATPLWMASQNNYVEVASLLLANGADANTISGDATALMIASQLGHAQIVKLLLDNGADVNEKSTDMGITALWIASQNGHTETVKVLLNNNADLDAKAKVNGAETTALMIAEKYGHAMVVQLLKGAAVQRSPRSAVPSDADPSSTNIGKTITNSIGMKLVYIKPGTFQMGSNNGKPDEKPVHEVHISKGFYMSETEVTQDQWERVMGKEPKKDDNLVSVGANYPKVFVSWKDTQEFCQNLSALEKEHTYKLPTEAQWEYACRAGTRTRFSFGNDEKDIDKYAWYKGNSTASLSGLQSAHEVGQKEPNPWGLYDMHGNVAERCRDNYVEDYYNRSPVDDPESKAGLSDFPPFVIRGGWSGDIQADCRSACRKKDELGARYNFLGFRIILEENDSIGRSDNDTTFSELEAEALRGNANAQNRLGFMYGAGRGVAQNHEEAAKWFRKAADQGFDAAQFNLGNAYATGRGVPQDQMEAAKWYRKAADQGFAFAEYQLGEAYLHGAGVPQDDNEAAKWFRKAADHGLYYAQYKMGQAYEYGVGVSQSYEEAAKWYRKAGDQGHADAQSKLGILYYKGLGVQKDYVQSYMWFTLSGQMAEPAKTTMDAINAQTDLVDKMTQDQKDEANRLAREWKANK